MRQDFSAAMKVFIEGYEKYRDHRKAVDNLLKAAMSLDRMGKREAACFTLAELDKVFPDAQRYIKDEAVLQRQRNDCGSVTKVRLPLPNSGEVKQESRNKGQSGSFKDQIGRLLNAPEQANDVTRPLTISEIDLVRRQIAGCWNLPAGAKEAEDLIIKIWVAMNPDGTVREARIQNQGRLRTDVFFRAAAESALRAVLNPRCGPLKLPRDKYDLWRTMTLTFNPREMFGKVKPAVGVYHEQHKPGDVFEDCPICPDMVVIPAGSFRMGDQQGGGATDEKPVHTVTIPHPFAVGKYEVTQAEYEAVMDNNPSHFKGERMPVEQVSWDDAKKFVRKLSNRTREEYRLLSEAEWEYMARAGSSTNYPWGNDIDLSRAKYNSRDGTVPVGSYAANAFGVYDTVGNVWEWVEDCWHDNYSGAPTDGSAWTSGGQCGGRVLRGGSWNYDVPWLVRSANRYGYLTDNRYNVLGFRVARTF